jgi:hypothetical protein
MLFQEYAARRQALKESIKSLESDLRQLEDRYFGQFPGIGDAVRFEGELYYIVESLHSDPPKYHIQKAKKDGSPSRKGKKYYFIHLDEIERL